MPRFHLQGRTGQGRHLHPQGGPVANDAMVLVAVCCGNNALEKFAATIVRGIKIPLKVSGCVEELAGCIFVHNVEAPAVSTCVWLALQKL